MNADLFTHPMITKPVYHGLDLRIPEDLGNQALARLGYVDVTAAPFGADPTGKIDSTRALQSAVRFARDHQMVCFFPAGDYAVSDTIECDKNYYYWHKDRIGPSRLHSCVLMGSTKHPSHRARIILSANSNGFADPDHPKHVIKFWARACRPRVKGDWSDLIQAPDEEQPNISYNQALINIDIVIGERNAGAIAVYLRAAQGSGVFSSTIDARHGHTGIEGGAGSGGSHFDVTVIGGRIGMDLDGAQCAPTVGAIKLIGQTETALRFSGTNALSAVGLDIRPAAGAAAIQCGTTAQNDPFCGHLSLVDSRIAYEELNTSIPAISTCKSLYVENVYIRNAAVAVEIDGKAVVGGSADWMRIAEFAKGASPRRHPHNSNYEYTFPVYSKGKVCDQVLEFEQTAPTVDLCSQHSCKDSFPSFESENVTNVKDAPYNALGDGLTDDGDALQRAIDENEYVFLPKGHFLVSKPLRLKANTKIFGIFGTLSNILIQEPGQHFNDEANPVPVLETPDTLQGDNSLFFFNVTIPRCTPGACVFRHQSANAVIFSCIFGLHNQEADVAKYQREKEPYYDLRAGFYNHAAVVARGQAGGKWYMHYEEQPIKGPDYRHLLIEGTSQPLAFYQLNIEHADCDAQMEIRNSRNIKIYAFKSERNSVPLLIRNSRDIDVYSWGGNATAFPGKSLIEIIDSANIRLTNLSDLGRLIGLGYDDVCGKGDPPDQWSFVIVKQGDVVWGAKPCERPALFSI